MADLWHTLTWPFTDDPASAASVIAVGCLTNVSCALLGCYLVLRRMSMLGDALSHAVLPGLVVAFMLGGQLSIGYLFAGALAAGLVSTFLIQTLEQQGGVPADASMGVVFTSLFALGVLLVARNISGVHFDTACVYEGELDQVAIHTVAWGTWEIPRQVYTIAPVLLINILGVLLLWKELKITAFDPALATTMGIPAGVMHYLLMALVSLTTVASFEAVGSILVVAMLITPAATAHLLCDRLSRMIPVAAGVGVACAVLGYWFSKTFNANTAGMMAVVAGCLYGVAVLFSPRYGILSTIVRNLRTSLRILREDLLAMLFRLEEMAVGRQLGSTEAVHAVGGGLLARWGLFTLLRRGQIEKSDLGLQLTDAGRQRARGLVRSHRLWEAYLVEHLGLPHDHVHAPAERMEHFIDQHLQSEIADELAEPATDPHGREIPDQ